MNETTAAPPAPPAGSIHARIDRDRQSLGDVKMLDTFREYARGVHRSTLNETQARVLRGLLGNLFCDNVCRMCLAAAANRLQLARFEVAAKSKTEKPITTFLADLWTRNRIPKLAGQVHLATARDGNHAVMLAWAGGAVRLVREPWWNGIAGVAVFYDRLGLPEYAAKEWTENGKKRRTVYFPDRFERYEEDNTGWHGVNPDGLGMTVPWLDRQKKPLGLPIVHFAYSILPNDGKGDGKKDDPDPRYGTSMLDGGVLGLQDEINDLHRDISAAARFAGYQMLYGTGITLAKDPETGEDIPLTVEPGAMFTADSPEASFGALPAGSLAELERALVIKLRAISRMTGVPVHLITGDWPSGAALMRAEMDLIETVRNWGMGCGPEWASVAHKATRLYNTFGGGSLDEDALISAIFAPPERHDPLTMAELIEKLEPFISKREALRIYGMAPADIDRNMTEREAEAKAAAEAMSAALDRGLPDGDDDEDAA